MFRTRYRYVYILALGIYSYLNILFTVGEKLFDFEISHPILAGFLTAMVLGIWELNRIAENNLNKIHQRLKSIHPLILLFTISLVNVVVVSVLEIMCLYLLHGMPIAFVPDHIKLGLAFGFRVNLFMHCINAIVFFVVRWKKAQVEAEYLKKVTVEAQFEALRNQINPHFLFNCFNVLLSLVYKDQDTSAKFISQLSNVYRYLLYSQQRKVVSLQDEVAFIESYLFLIKIRFGSNVIIRNELKDPPLQFAIAPAVLQMLIENAIKHNVISKAHPLFISLYTRNERIYVENNLQEKTEKESSTSVGLQNIISRYEFLSDKKVEVTKTQSKFVVSVPILEVDIS